MVGTHHKILVPFAPSKGDKGIFKTSLPVLKMARLPLFYKLTLCSTQKCLQEVVGFISMLGRKWRWKFMSSGAEMPLIHPGQITHPCPAPRPDTPHPRLRFFICKQDCKPREMPPRDLCAPQRPVSAYVRAPQQRDRGGPPASSSWWQTSRGPLWRCHQLSQTLQTPVCSLGQLQTEGRGGWD